MKERKSKENLLFNFSMKMCHEYVTLLTWLLWRSRLFNVKVPGIQFWKASGELELLVRVPVYSPIPFVLIRKSIKLVEKLSYTYSSANGFNTKYCRQPLQLRVPPTQETVVGVCLNNKLRVPLI